MKFSLEITSKTDLSILPKIALIIGMVLGRLEILVALSLITFGLNRV